MVDVAALTNTGSAAGNNAIGSTPQGAGAQAAAAAAQAAAAALSDSGTATSGISGGVKFGDISTSSGGGFSLSNKKLIYIGAFVLGGMLIYGLTIKK